MKPKRWGLDCGRVITLKGKPFVAIMRVGETHLADADSLTRKIVKLLNMKRRCRVTCKLKAVDRALFGLQLHLRLLRKGVRGVPVSQADFRQVVGEVDRGLQALRKGK